MTHYSIEDLSEYIDAEVAPAIAQEIAEHISGCSACAKTESSLRAVSVAVADLPAAAPSPAEGRAIRTAVLDSAPRQLRWVRAWRLAAALGAIGVIAVGAVVAGGDRHEQDTVGGSAMLESAPTEAAYGQEFAGPADVKQFVESDPQIKEAVNRWKVSDVGQHQTSEIRRLATALHGSESLAQSSTRAADSASAPPERAAGVACVEMALESQPFPMMPIMAERVTFEGKPALLAIFAYTTRKQDPAAPLDAIQAWVLKESDCSTLQFATYRP